MKHETMVGTWREMQAHAAGMVGWARPKGDGTHKYYTGAGGVVEMCADDFEAACELRPPRAEWFGNPDKEPGKWDAWWIEWVDGKTEIYRAAWAELCPNDMWFIHRKACPDGGGFRKGWDIKNCVPVARSGFPSAVGWQVVGEK